MVSGEAIDRVETDLLAKETEKNAPIAEASRHYWAPNPLNPELVILCKEGAHSLLNAKPERQQSNMDINDNGEAVNGK